VAGRRDPLVILITGDKGSGKTSSMMEVLRWASERSIEISGIISPRCFDGKVLVGYDALDCRSGERFGLARKPGYARGGGWMRFGGLGYVFSRSGLERANGILGVAARRQRGAEILMVDEVGRLELMGKGLAPGLEQVLSSMDKKPLVALVSCRLGAVDMVRSKACETGARTRVWRSGDVPDLTEILESLTWTVA